jgi:prolyl-tRNA synthetase
MFDTYTRIFNRFHLRFVPVLADTGAIGGNGSHQFMALSDVGESDIIYCDCGYAADQEKAETKKDTYRNDEVEEKLEEVFTPVHGSISELASYLKVNEKDIAKSVLYKDLAHDELVLVLVRGDREVNEIKIVNKLDIAEFELVLASEEDLKKANTYAGFMGPLGINVNKILVDEELTTQKNFFVGANKNEYHIKNVNYGRDFKGEVGQFRKSVEGDICPCCGKKVKMERGIEVGQIFKLGTKYSAAMNCSFQDDDGTVKPMVMGCYGIGVTRTMSAIIDQYHDEFGIKWPLNVAPYHAVVVPVNYNDETQKQVADNLYNKLNEARVEVVLDDRNERPGFKFKDWELIGIPYMVIVGKRANEGIVELKNRQTLEKKEVTIEDAIKIINEAVKSI